MRRHLVVTSFLLLAVYGYTMPRTVTLEDSGLFLLSSWFAGVSHPPGYPLHSVLGKLFTLLPIGSPAVRVHLVSALGAAATAAVLWWIVFRLTRARAAAYAAALGYGVSREFWAQAIIAEVYSLHTLLFFLCVACALAYRDSGSRRLARACALVFGLGLAHHWPLFLVASPGALWLLWPRRRELRSDVGMLVLCLVLGALPPYVYLVARSRMNPEISFYGPLDSLQRIVFFISRSGYATSDATATASFTDKVQFAGFLGREMAAQFTPLGLIAATAGLVILWRRDRNLAVASGAMFFGSSFLLVLLLSRDYEHIQRAVFQVYPLVAYGAMAIWIGVATARCGPRARIALVVALLSAEVFLHSFANLRRGDRWAHEYAAAVLGALEPNAVLLTHGDVDTGAIGYLNRVLKVRPDVTLYNDQGLVFSNRDPALGELVRRTERPVYYTGAFAHPFGVVDLGIVRKVDKTGARSVSTTETLLRYLRPIVYAKQTPVDAWTIDHRNLLIASFMRALAPMAVRDPGRFGELVATMRHNVYGEIAFIEAFVETEKPAQLLDWIHAARMRVDDTTSKAARHALDRLEAFARSR